MRDIPREELGRLPVSLLRALVRLDGFPSDYAGSLSQATLGRIHDIAQESEEQAGCPSAETGQPAVLVRGTDG
jgi:hypothetical protein